MCCCTVDKVLQRFFYAYSFVLYKHRWVFLLVPIFVTAILASGFCLFELRKSQANDTEYVFTPIHRRALKEKATLARLWPLTQDRFMPGKSFEMRHWIDVVVTAKDGLGVLRPQILAEISDLNNYILYNFSMPFTDNSETYAFTYSDLCLTWEWECFGNPHVQMFQQKPELKRLADSGAIGRIQINSFYRYPRGGSGDTPAYFGTQIGGVEVNRSANDEIVDAQALRLVYNLAQDPIDPGSLLDYYSKEFKYALQDYLVTIYRSNLIDIGIFHSTSLDQALEFTAETFLPNVTVTIFILAAFSVVCSLVLLPVGKAVEKDKNGAPHLRVDWVRSKPFLAIFGVVAAGLAVVSSYGLLMLLGMGYNVIAIIMPFLIFAIGVDNMFILTAAWHRTNPQLQTADRLAHTLSEAAVAITITSLTDCLSFTVGCLSEIPGVWIFCSYTAVAICFSYVYQITFFCATVAFAGDAERRGRHCLFYAKVVPPEKADTRIKSIFFTGTVIHPSNQPQETSLKVQNGTTPPPLPDKNITETCSPEHQIPSIPHETQEPSIVSEFFRKYYGPFILNPISKVCILLCFILYLLFAIWGTFQLKEGLTPEHLIVRDHYASDYYSKIVHFWKQGFQAHVVIEKPPNFELYEDRMQFENVLQQFESSPHCMGRNATVFWYLEYLQYLNGLNAEIENTTEMWNDRLLVWIEYTGGKNLWDMDMVWSDEDEEGWKELKAFRFKIGLKNYITSNDHRRTAEQLRSIADSYPEYKITVYHEYFPFVDQYTIILPTTLRNIAIAVTCMICVSLFMIPSVPCALIIVAAIVTIDLGVLGYMAWWSVHLDAISMIAIIMSIGFAVDLSAHISYAYVKADCCETPRGRAIRALETLGWPVFQGGFSTILGVLVLSTMEAYIILTFFKTVFLVIFFGMVHSLVFLPVALTVLLPKGKIELFKKTGRKIQDVEVNQVESSESGESEQAKEEEKN